MIIGAKRRDQLTDNLRSPTSSSPPTSCASSRKLDEVSALPPEYPGRMLARQHRSAAHALFQYAWPLNIRELEQALLTATALTDTGEIHLEHLPEAIRTYQPGPTVTATLPEDQALGELLVKLLREHDGAVGAVGRAMGKAPMQIRRWCYHLQIELSQFRKQRRVRRKP